MTGLDDQYLETRVLTAAPEQLHLLVLEGAIRHAKQAVQEIEEQNFEKSFHALGLAREFVSELVGGLDTERSPELVADLKSMFLYVYRNLIKADMEHDPQLVRDAVHILESHRETWLALMERLKHEKPQQENMPAPKGHSLGHLSSDSAQHEGRSWTA